MAGVAVHVPQGPRGAAVRHQDGDLVRGLGGQRPEIPLHVVVAQAGVRLALLGVDEVLELARVADEEHRGVVAHQVEVALLGVKLEREPARVPVGVRAAHLARDRGEPREHRGPLAHLRQKARLGPLADVLGHLEEPVRTAALGVHHPLGHALAIEVLHLLDHIVVVQHRRPARARRQRELITRRGNTRIRRRDWPLIVHASPPRVRVPRGNCPVGP